MDKMRMESQDLTQANIDKIAEIFPGALTEAKDENGKLKKAVNFDILKQILSSDVVDGDEAYEFTWVGKKASIVEAGKPIRKTLRPVVENEITSTGEDSAGEPYRSSGSKNWESTENIYIEGDNFDVLKLLQESYLGKINIIYIDPPYNTGNDFLYKDKFSITKDEYDDDIGVYDKDGIVLFRNSESFGRFHSNWCSMIYARLKLALNLLADGGIIAVSINDKEIFQLGKIMDELFGSNNKLACAPWLSEASGGKEKTGLRTGHEYLLVYAKNKSESTITQTEKATGELNLTDQFGSYRKGRELMKWGGASLRQDRPNQFYELLTPYGFSVYPYRNDGKEGHWRWGKENKNILVAQQETDFFHWERTSFDSGVTVDGKTERWVPYVKIRDTKKAIGWSTWLDKVGTNAEGTRELKELFGFKIFDTPKPTQLIKWVISLHDDDNSIVLDFFSGAAVTAQATAQLNAEDGGNRKFIMVQLPEECAPDSEAAKAGYANICEIGKERIRRAGEKIKADNAGKDGIENLDIGFRVLKLDSTNMKDVYYGADEYDQGKLTDLISNIKDDRNDMDLLYGCLLEWGLPLSLPHTSENIGGVTVHTYNNGDLIACFAPKVSETVVREIAGRKPLRVVFRDSSFADAPAKINVAEIFKLMAPNTTIKVL